ncbi:MAG: serine/threonine-protein kinase [Paracoccaceae bacterium]
MNTVVAIKDDEDGEFTDELKAGTSLLQGQFVIQGFLNSGGFGMTYLATDSLDRTVVIKECFPATVCKRSDNAVRARTRAHQKDFRSIVRLFLQEARQLAKLRHPNIVGVHQVFEDNETAYMALDFVDGLDLLDIIEDGKHHIQPGDLRQIVISLLGAVGYMHEQNILHRDISPDNILLDQSGSPVLIDFGAAREKASHASRAMSALVVVKDGYSPQEFYVAGSEQGPSSDLYALAATLYHLITGEAPPNSQARVAAMAEQRLDPYVPTVGRIAGYDQVFLAAIDKGLSVFPKNRFQSAQDWVDALDPESQPEQATRTIVQLADIDKSISALVTETNKAVREAQKNTVVSKPIVEDVPRVSKLREKFAEIAKELALDAEEAELEYSDADHLGRIDKPSRDMTAIDQHSDWAEDQSNEPIAGRSWFRRLLTNRRRAQRLSGLKKQRKEQFGKARP